MPLDNDQMKGTEKDGSKSNEYCVYCYTNGAFTSPDLTLDGMKEIVKTQMTLRKLPPDLINTTLSMLPTLGRWQVQPSKPQ